MGYLDNLVKDYINNYVSKKEEKAKFADSMYGGGRCSFSDGQDFLAESKELRKKYNAAIAFAENNNVSFIRAYFFSRQAYLFSRNNAIE
jgi:hypothetical protein